MADFPSFVRNLMLTRSTLALSIIPTELRSASNNGHSQTNRCTWMNLCVTVEGSSRVNALPSSSSSAWPEMSNKSNPVSLLPHLVLHKPQHVVRTYSTLQHTCWDFHSITVTQLHNTSNFTEFQNRSQQIIFVSQNDELCKMYKVRYGS